MVHPVEMRQLGVEGEVVVEFFVERSGVISGVSVVKSLSKSFDDEAIRLTRNMPRWVPGKKNGVPVRSGAQLAAGDFVNMRFADGAALAQVMDHSGKEDSCGG